MEKKCMTCELYQFRLGIAQGIGDIFGTEGRWDYETCNKACVVQSKEEIERYEKAKKHWRDKYRLDHPGVIPGHRRHLCTK